MKILGKYEVCNQSMRVWAIDGDVYHSWLEDKQGNRDKDDNFWHNVITPEMQNLLIEDHHNGVIPKDMYMGSDFSGIKRLTCTQRQSLIICLSNWYWHCYMSWNPIDKCWIYGRNKNYIFETGKKIEFTEEYQEFLNRMQERYENRKAGR